MDLLLEMPWPAQSVPIDGGIKGIVPYYFTQYSILIKGTYIILLPLIPPLGGEFPPTSKKIRLV